ncbi:hypothetical protein Thimo_2746 [Thioflavicoccus mobilis 8321]|uniref:30S ribosomal protein THX n=1 Tax=Thioflavicoccus mobilis 8321 TaxID=765912 RepID=L0GZR2_9GAMM|nr:hypothetical protein Thimo_2746 [Thioflavicoccus mobilis 8321]
MAKSDKRSRRSKITNGSHGRSRPQKGSAKKG